MRLLFLTNYNCPISGEHYFTKGVWDALCKRFECDSNELLLGTIFYVGENIKPYVIEENDRGHVYYKFYCPSVLNEEEIIAEIYKFYSAMKPDVIHANMIQKYEVLAAHNCNIPIILTIHIGGFICPRGGLHGLMNYKDSICDTKIGRHCLKCCSRDLPFSTLSYFLYRMLPNRLLSFAYERIGKKNLFYLSQFLISYNELIQRSKDIEIYKNTTIIAANQRLKDILALNGLTDNVVLLPHGVKNRQRYPFPEIKNMVKFFYFGRIQYAKGLHNLLRAFDGIDNSLYELHIVGEIANIGKSKRYMAQLMQYSKGKNVFFHDTIANENLESFIKDMHVMIHPTICLEVYGISIAESLSLGRPVLATRCGGAEMQVKDGVNGWLVPSNDVAALHNKILHVIQHKEEIVSMSENSRLPHSLSQYADSLVSLYKSLIRVPIRFL